MMLACFLFLLLTVVKSSSGDCTHQDVVKHLNLTGNNELYSMTRPGSAERPVEVLLDVLLYAILELNEKEQKFVTYVWLDTKWQSDNISWNPDDFCGINKIYLPTKMLWKPDIIIEEMMNNDNSVMSPYLIVRRGGAVELRKAMMVVSACKMQIYKFPFDVQHCNLSFKSVIHSDNDMKLSQGRPSISNLEWSYNALSSKSEWMFHELSIDEKTVNNFGYTQSMLVYTITMERHSALYIVNLLLPITFFLCLDLASFLISDRGGEKLGFKVSVLLAVTVMQLILNDILPSTSDRIPLIAVYCIGSFSLMMLSLVETMVVMFLMEKDSQDKEESSSQLTEEESHDSERLSDELKEEMKTLTRLLSSRKEEMKPTYWTTVAKTINKVFFIVYIIAATLFLCVMGIYWLIPEL